MKKQKLLKLADFIEKLPPRKLDMGSLYGKLNGSEKLDPHRCKSVAGALGWASVLFPRELQFEPRYVGATEAGGDVVLRSGKKYYDEMAAAKVFNIPVEHAEWLFGPGAPCYRTPKQVASAIRKYVKTGKVPRQCVPPYDLIWVDEDILT